MQESNYNKLGRLSINYDQYIVYFYDWYLVPAQRPFHMSQFNLRQIKIF